MCVSESRCPKTPSYSSAERAESQRRRASGGTGLSRQSHFIRVSPEAPFGNLDKSTETFCLGSGLHRQTSESHLSVY